MTTLTTPVTRTVDGRDVPAAGAYAVDASHTHAGFTVRHMMVSKVRGAFADVTGTVTIGDDPLESSVEVEVATNSIDTRDENRDAHLRSGDFLDVERFPTMTYRSTGVRAVGGGRWEVAGALTLAGVTRPLALSVEFEGATIDPWGNRRIGFSARGEFDRTDFGLTWNQVLETGGIAVGKKISLEIEAEAVAA